MLGLDSEILLPGQFNGDKRKREGCAYPAARLPDMDLFFLNPDSLRFETTA